MSPFSLFPAHLRENIRYVLTDIDDTLTCRGKLTAVVFTAMERLQQAGIKVVPVTGRPAGWCDHMARMWPVDGIVGENGAFYFRYDPKRKKMQRRYWKSDSLRRADRQKLHRLSAEITQKIPGCRVSADQAYREADLAIDYCEDVPELPKRQVQRIVALFETAGANAKVSSIHVNGWFGDYDKLAMTKKLFAEVFSQPLDAARKQVIFSGDSPNDAPLFGYFPHAVGVANVLKFKGVMACEPAWITRGEGGYGFAEIVDTLLV